MKHMRKIFSIFLTMILALGLTVPAFAAETVGSITINDSATVSVAGKTFNAYKVMEATLANGENAEGGIAYSVPEALKTFYAQRYSLDAASTGFDSAVAEKIAEEEDINAFAKAVLAAAKGAGITPGSATAGDSAKSITIPDLPVGYYVVEDVGAATPIAALSLTTTALNPVIELKADKPGVDKKIDGDKDADPSTTGTVDSNNASIGDTVPFVVTSKVPDMRGYTKYFFVLKDTLSKGLAFDDNVAITVGNQTLTKDTDFTVTTTSKEDGTTSVKIVFLDFYNKFKDNAGETITITYSAKVDSDAVIGVAGNPNTVNLTYSNNPNVEPTGENEPSPQDPIGTTPDSVTKTFVTGIKLIKVDNQGNRLVGAEFKIEGNRLNTTLVEKDVFTLDVNGTYWKLKDGTYTTEEPTEGNTALYASTTDKYVRETQTSTITKAQNVTYSGVVGDDGILRFNGLGAGEYTITELVAPIGYNLLDAPITITISCDLPENITGDCTWNVTAPSTVTEGVIQLTIQNLTGTELPSTGGVGTTLFYILGGLLVAGAIIAFVVKNRMSAER